MKCVLMGEVDPEAYKLLEKNGIKLVNINEKDVADCEILSVRVDNKVDKSLLDKAKNLKYILANSIGTDHIDMEECKKRNIKVLNAPQSNIESVAELVICDIIACMRNLILANSDMKKGNWEKKKYRGNEIAGKTIGILGFGAIGKLVAKKLSGFGVKIMVYDVIKYEEAAKKLNTAYYSLDEIYKESDVITVHVPLLPSTINMIGKEQFSKMKDGVIFINLARGPIVDENALVDAVKSGKVRAAALDVYCTEPLPKDSPLLKFDNIITTPHLGGVTIEGFNRMCMIPATALISEIKK